MPSPELRHLALFGLVLTAPACDSGHVGDEVSASAAVTVTGAVSATFDGDASIERSPSGRLLQLSVRGSTSGSDYHVVIFGPHTEPGTYVLRGPEGALTVRGADEGYLHATTGTLDLESVTEDRARGSFSFSGTFEGAGGARGATSVSREFDAGAP